VSAKQITHFLHKSKSNLALLVSNPRAVLMLMRRGLFAADDLAEELVPEEGGLWDGGSLCTKCTTFLSRSIEIKSGLKFSSWGG
jgi:hypothetical protein